MAILRLPNPGSDFERFVSLFQTIYRDAKKKGLSTFDLDFMMDVVADRSLVSSSGAVGTQALARSRRADRSRDPMYNQVKMYSELLRMLGWLHSEPHHRLEFRPTLFAETIDRASVPLPEPYKRLMREMLLAITFPNPNTDNRGIVNHRPYLRTLQLMELVGGRLSRDEAIITIYAISDDRRPGIIDRAAETVLAVRGQSRNLAEALAHFCYGNSVQVNTAKNYTRMLVGALTSPIVDWCESYTNRQDYERPMHFMRLTVNGRAWAHRAIECVDVRWADVSKYDAEKRAAFVNLAYYSMFKRCEFPLSEEAPLIARAYSDCKPILHDLGLADYRDMVFSPLQEAPLTELAAAGEYASAGTTP